MALVTAIILMLVVVSLLAREVTTRPRKRRARVEGDRLVAAISKIESGDFSDDILGLESGPFARVGTAYEKMVPAIRSTIEELEWHARHDALSGALNAGSFKHQCQALLNRGADDSLIGGALLFVDINDFKKINDSLGHEAGDRFLVMCADRIRLACSSFKSSRLSAFVAGEDIDAYHALVGRLGGDEFGIFLPGNPEPADVQKFVFRLQRLIAEPCQIGAHALNAQISIGIAFSRDQHNSFDKLLAAADTAMYEAKRGSGDGYCYYDEAMRKRADQILERELEIRQGIQQSHFKLYFQPQVNLATNRIESAEALIRWDHPVRGIVGPDEFIPFAEKYNLIDDLGDWVLAEAIATVARWRRQGRDIRVSINVSPKQLNRVELIPLIRALLELHELPSHAIEIEITEAALMRSDDIPMERIKGLRDDGVAIALDDFGTGYGSTFTIRVARDLTSELLPQDRAVEAVMDADVTPRATARTRPLALIMEDEPSAVELLKRLLDRNGYQCVVAGDGEAGLDMAKAQEPDLVLLDIGLPRIDGWEVLEQFAKDERLRAIPTVVISVDDRKQVSIELGASDHLVKPVQTEELDAILKLYSTKKGHSILLVEDDPATGQMYHRGLQQCGFKVTRAANGAEASALLALGGFAMVVTDLMMPQSDGYELISRIAEIPAESRPPVIVVTGAMVPADKQAQLEGNVNSIHLKSGLTPRRLAERISELLHD